jgi:DNA repair protein RadD
LLHQIIGRIVRISPGKTDGLLLDYAGNVDNHHPDGDLFSPEIKRWNSKGESKPIRALCPDCGVENEFSARKNEDGFGIDEHGYFIDLDGNRVTCEYGAMPAHYGRRCYGMELIKGQMVRCEYRWTFKECPECQHENDIAARYCCKCKAEIVDPNAKLISDFKALKRDPYRMQCDKVLSWDVKKTVSGAGNECMVVDFLTEQRKVTIWYQIRSANEYLIKQYEKFIKITDGMQSMPESITYRKENSGFYKIFNYNQQVD